MIRKQIISLAMVTHTPIGYFKALPLQELWQTVSDVNEIARERKVAADG